MLISADSDPAIQQKAVVLIKLIFSRIIMFCKGKTGKKQISRISRNA